MASTSVIVKDFPFKAKSAATAANSWTVGAGNLGLPIDVGLCTHGSFQLEWASITGTPDATFSVMTSNDGVTWQAKGDANGNPVVFTMSGASGNDMISFNDTISEEFYGLAYAPVDATGGTINVIFIGK
jgi:hypothetical protein